MSAPLVGFKVSCLGDFQMRCFQLTTNAVSQLGRAAICLVLAASVTALTPTKAAATTFTLDLCDVNAAECAGDNLTEASLSFTTIDGTADLNDYDLIMTLIGTGTDFINAVSFTINGVDNVTGATGYETQPTVVGPGGGWTAYYDNVSNATSCTSDTNNSQEVCASSVGPGESVDGTNTWTWFVDISDALGVIGGGTGLNLRANFLTAAGGPGGNFSPGGGIVSTTTDVVTTIITDTEDLPEPTLLALLGAGLAGVSLRLRQRKARKA